MVSYGLVLYSSVSKYVGIWLSKLRADIIIVEMVDRSNDEIATNTLDFFAGGYVRLTHQPSSCSQL
jgi:NADPH-dependent 2,4-dienoyl-CoA reductase/sulfur reductase-like enzyme